MSQKDKLIERLLSKPSDFSFDEAATLLNHLGYAGVAAGKTSGSRIAFANASGDYIRLHKPHPQSILKKYQVTDLISALKERGLV